MRIEHAEFFVPETSSMVQLPSVFEIPFEEAVNLGYRQTELERLYAQMSNGRNPLKLILTQYQMINPAIFRHVPEPCVSYSRNIFGNEQEFRDAYGFQNGIVLPKAISEMKEDLGKMIEIILKQAPESEMLVAENSEYAVSAYFSELSRRVYVRHMKEKDKETSGAVIEPFDSRGLPVKDVLNYITYKAHKLVLNSKPASITSAPR